jgi:NAD(P)-dependent dehydrogenase (short-subunit alcohol dehydrogenase family)
MSRLLLAREGARVIVNDPGVGRGGEPPKSVRPMTWSPKSSAAGGTALANYDSVADYQKAGRMVAQCVDTWGKIDILVNVAGMLRER